MNNRVRYNLSDIQMSSFFQMPKFLFNKEFKGLSSDAKILYCLLKDRHELSLSNKWFDSKGDVFLIYTRKEMECMLGLSDKTVNKAMKNLKEFNLVDEIRQGLNKPNKIYLLTTTNPDYTRSRRISDSGDGDFPIQESENFRPINTDINNTDINNQSINQSYSNSNTKDKNMIDEIDNKTYIEYMEIIKENIDYEFLITDFKHREDILNEMLDLLVLTICSNKTYIRVNGVDEPSAIVKSQFLKLNSEHIKYVDECMQNSTTKKSNIKNYLLTALYNAPTSLGNYYQASVMHDLYGKKDK